MMERRFTCGHSAKEPLNMGRGAAREARVTAYFDRKCLACRLLSEEAFEASLTIPRTEEKKAAARQRLVNSY